MKADEEPHVAAEEATWLTCTGCLALLLPYTSPLVPCDFPAPRTDCVDWTFHRPELSHAAVNERLEASHQELTEQRGWTIDTSAYGGTRQVPQV